MCYNNLETSKELAGTSRKRTVMVLFLYNCLMPEYSSEFHTIDQQIEKLEKRNIVVDNKQILNKINYSHLIYKFGEHYLESNDLINYKKGTKISHIYNFYLFNIELSKNLYTFFNLFEHKLKAITAHFLSQGDSTKYLDEDFYEIVLPNNKISKRPNEKNIKKFIEKIKKLEVERKDKYNAKHLKNNKLPLWLIIDEMTIGDIRQLIKYSKNKVKEIYNKIKIAPRKSWKLTMIHLYRNPIMHMDIIKPYVQNFNDKKYYFSDFLLFIKMTYPFEFDKIDNFLKEYDYDKMNLSKEYIFKYFGLI